MTYSGHGGRSRSRTDLPGSSSRQYASGGRPRVPGQGSYHGPTGTRSRGNGSLRGTGGRGGYPVRARSINFQGARGRRASDRRLLILAALALVLVILLVAGVSSCVRSCSSGQGGTDNLVDARVASGVSEELTKRFSPELDQAEKLAGIASSANRYADQALLELALDQPAAIGFVAAYPDAEKTAQPYGDSVSAGTVPELYCWDARWGNVDYAGHALALTGSGPCALSMAYMGLTGSVDRSPADLASAAAEAGLATGDSSMSAEFVSSAAEGMGLACKTYVSNGDNLSHSLSEGACLMIEAKAGTLTDDAHWVLLVGENEDGSVVVHDPTSPAVSAHPWNAATLASSCDTLYALTVASSESGADE